jgi:hypothetical protein
MCVLMTGYKTEQKKWLSKDRLHPKKERLVVKRTVLVWLLVGALLVGFGLTSQSLAQEATAKSDAEPETYIHVVVKGDTLWDICEALYGNPWVWPKVWQLNPFITNPHWIYPGTELRVYYEVPKSFETAAVVEEAAPEPEAEPESVPPPTPPPPPPPKVPTLTFSEIDQVGFITPFKPEGAGTIVGGKSQRTLIGKADTIFVQLQESSQPEVGERFFVFETSSLIEHPVTKRDVGYLNTILGVLEVVQVAPDHAKAVVTDSFQEMNPGDKLMPYKKRSAEITLQPGTEPIEGNIILSRGQSFLIAQRQIVFIDLGEEDGIKAGQSFEVIRQPTALTSRNEEVVLSIQPVGELLVLAVEPETAAALVTESLSEFVPGERVRMKTGNF